MTHLKKTATQAQAKPTKNVPPPLLSNRPLARLANLLASHLAAAFILLAFIGLAVIYSLVTPPFEAGDESRHYAVVKYMADTGRLPVQNRPETRAIQHHWSHEGNQPPLYYALAAGLTAWIETGGWDEVFWYNPHTSIGDPLRSDNKNITIHPPGERWPWRGHVLAVHLIRFLSIAMAAVTVTAAYAIALRLFRGDRRLAAGAMAVTAFNPMFIFISASINNDNAVIMFVTLALWLMVSLVAAVEPDRRSGNEDLPADPAGPPNDAPPMPLYRPALLGLLIGLGALSKLYAFGLLPLAGLLFLGLAYARSARPAIFWRRFLLWSAGLSLVFIVTAGWFYLRNALLYDGDFLALEVMRDTAGQRREAPSLATIRAEFEGFRIAYWALFGGVNILADAWLYRLLDGLSLIAALGLLAFIFRFGRSLITLTPRKQPPCKDSGRQKEKGERRFTPAALRQWAAPWALPAKISKDEEDEDRVPSRSVRDGPGATFSFSPGTFLILLLWLAIMLAGFIVWNLTQPAGQGRLMYPAIAAISALGLLGLTWPLPARFRKYGVICCGLGLFLLAALAPFLYIAPAYAKPPLLTRADLPAGMQPVDFIYDGKIRLLGYRLQTDTVRPAQQLPITLYWELLEPVEVNYSIFIHLLGRGRQVIGQRDSYPGGGRRPTTLLEPGDIVAGAYDVPVAPQAEFEHAPTRLQIAAGVYHLDEPGRPGKPAVDEAGRPVEPIIAAVKLAPWQWPDPPHFEETTSFAGKATLLSYELAGDQQALTLNWQVEQPFETDYTVFIQAWNAHTNEYAAGFDGPPVGNDYPTSLWAPGETIVDVHPLDLSSLPPGAYNLLVGLYNPLTEERLPAFGPAGPRPDNAVNAGVLQIKGSQE